MFCQAGELWEFLAERTWLSWVTEVQVVLLFAWLGFFFCVSKFIWEGFTLRLFILSEKWNEILPDCESCCALIVPDNSRDTKLPPSIQDRLVSTTRNAFDFCVASPCLLSHVQQGPIARWFGWIGLGCLWIWLEILPHPAMELQGLRCCYPIPFLVTLPLLSPCLSDMKNFLMALGHKVFLHCKAYFLVG